ncbi:MAG TPA: HEAT repeat domain-containing protein, partial [Candidatus Dormibacteraeota bacterium]|nr:HEAT repeat domain-containing protein [Candidatus Dormibacteraeota bacterium]
PFELFDIHLYEKGSWVLWMLRHVLGDELFLAGVHEYVSRHAQGLVVTEDLVRAMEDTTGRSLGWFFDQWIYGGGHPEFKVAYKWHDDGRTAALTVRQEQQVDAVTHVFRMPVQVAFGIKGGKVEVREVEVGTAGPDDAFNFVLGSRPTWVRFDEGNRVLKILSFDRPEELLISQLREDEMTGRVEAALQLGRKATPKAVDALAAALDKDGFWFVQAAAARALGTAQGDRARRALVAGLEHPHSRVRSAAAVALGSFRGDDEVAGPLLRTLDRDRSYAAAGAAAAALGRTGARSAVPALEQALDRPSHRNAIAIGALRGLAELRDPSLLGAILARARPGQAERVRAEALVSAARLARATGREQRDEVRRVAEKNLRDPLFFVRRGALQSLEVLGDQEAIPALRAAVERDVEGAVRYEARVAIDNLRRGTAREQELSAVRDDVEELRRANRELREKLARIEGDDRKGRSHK